MNLKSLSKALLVAALLAGGNPLRAASLEAPVQKKVDELLVVIKQWAADPAIVNGVKQQNTQPSADVTGMTQDKWKAATVLDPFVRELTKNATGAFLKTKKSAVVTEAFVSDAKGLKVGFIAKTSGWSHQGKAKHDQPMTGAVWQGEIEVDDSTGLQQLQVAVPVLDGGKPIGSLVVGLAVAKLTE